MLYPLCCTETKILIDQLRKNPEKFLSSPSNQLAISTSPWRSIMAYGKFSWYERIVVKLELRLQHIAYTRSDILAALLDPTTRNPYDTYQSVTSTTATKSAKAPVKVIPRTSPFAPNPVIGVNPNPFTTTTTVANPNPYATSTISGSGTTK